MTLSEFLQRAYGKDVLGRSDDPYGDFMREQKQNPAFAESAKAELARLEALDRSMGLARRDFALSKNLMALRRALKETR